MSGSSDDEISASDLALNEASRRGSGANPEANPHDTSDAWRIIDANSNRAVEGLRVTEDYLRFHREDAFLSRICKQIRHQVSETLASCGRHRLANRSTDTDVGTEVDTTSEYERSDLSDVAAANLRRASEAFRSLEEFAKVISPVIAKKFETLRYKTYTLEKAVGHLEHSATALEQASVYVLVDLHFGTGEEFQRRVQKLVEGGVGVIQLRDKAADDRTLVEAARLLHKTIFEKHAADGGKDGTRTRPFLIINDRPDIARITHADGVHVGQDELSVVDARRVVGADALIGVSTHSVDQARQAVLDGADYIGVGPVFESSTKSFDEFVGVELLTKVAAEVSLPAYAIGGITSERLDDVVRSGIRRVAVSGAIWRANDVAASLSSFKATLERNELQ